MAFSKNRRLADIIADTSGNINVPTQSASDNDTSAASTAYVTTAVSGLIDSAPGTLNTLNEIAAALNDDANFNTTVTNAIAAKLPLAGGTLTGDLRVGTADAANRTITIAGGATGNDEGGEIRLEMAADHDSAYEFWRIDVNQDDLRFGRTGETDVLIDSSGKVGIGTSTPGSLLTIHNSSTAGNTELHVHNNKSGDAAVLKLEGKRSSINDTAQVLFANNGNNVAKIDARSAADDGELRFFTSASGSGSSMTQRMLIDTSGNVGIGETSPDASLHITSNTPTIAFDESDASQDYRIGSFGGAFALYDQTDSAYRLVVDGSGNVGIGTSSPQNTLHVATGATDSRMQFTNASSGSAYADGLWVGHDNTQAYFMHRENLPITFWTNTTNRMSIESDGDVTIGSGASNIDIGIGNTGTVGHLGREGSGALIHLGGDDCQVRLANSILHHDNSGNTNLYLRNHYTTLGNDNAAKITLEAGTIVFATSTGYSRAMQIGSNGTCHAAYTGSADTGGYFYAGKDWGASNHRINRGVSQGNIILVISAYNSSSQDTALFYGCTGQDASGTAAGLRMQKNSSTNRSINAAGTINASGSDYAEYVKKSDTCGTIAKGDICGIDANSKITDKWSEAHSFVVKSTDPSYVGGDTWGTLKRPELTLQGHADPDNPADESDSEYAARTTQHETDLAAFEIALEAERVKYDRIAFSGQVPCNLTGASVGDYIIAKEGTSDTIIGEAVSTPTFEQYQKAVGKVWKVLDNGNAWIAVKIG